MDVERISKEYSANLVEGLDEEVWQTRCRHSPDSSPCLHPLRHLTLKHSLPLSLDLTMCLALAKRMKEKCDCGTSTSMTQEALLFLVTLSSPRGHVQGGQLEREGHMEQVSNCPASPVQPGPDQWTAFGYTSQWARPSADTEPQQVPCWPLKYYRMTPLRCCDCCCCCY